MTDEERVKIFSQLVTDCVKTGQYGNCSPMTRLAIRCAGNVMADKIPEPDKQNAMLGLCDAAIAGMDSDRSVKEPVLNRKASYVEYIYGMRKLVQSGNWDRKIQTTAQRVLQDLHDLLWRYSVSS